MRKAHRQMPEGAGHPNKNEDLPLNFSNRPSANLTRRTRSADRLGEGKNTRANWQRLLDQYLARARSLANTDRVEAENCYQHADHYLRMIQGTAV